MILTVTCRGRSGDGSSYVCHLLHVVVDVLQDAADAWLEERPATSVLLLLLAPHVFNVLAVLLHLSAERVEGEWSQLLNSDDCDVSPLLRLTLGNQIVVDLTRTQNHLAHVVWLDVSVSLWQNTLEFSALYKFTNIRAHFSHFEHLLWRNNNKGLAEWTQHLAAQNVEVLSGSCAVHDLNVALFVQVTLWQRQW